MLSIEHLLGGFLNRGDDVGRNLTALPGKRFRLRDRVFDHRRLLHYVAVLFPVGVGDAEQYPAKAGTSISIPRREIRPAIKRLTARREKGSERPSALSADRLHRRLVSAIDIRALIAINFHCYEVLI